MRTWLNCFGVGLLAGAVAVWADDREMNWGRATGEGFSNIRTFVMDVSSLNIGPDQVTPFDPEWGEPMQDE